MNTGGQSFHIETKVLVVRYLCFLDRVNKVLRLVCSLLLDLLVSSGCCSCPYSKR